MCIAVYIVYSGVYCVWGVGIVTEVGCNNSDLNEHRSYSSCVSQMQLLSIVDKLRSIPRARLCLSKGDRAMSES